MLNQRPGPNISEFYTGYSNTISSLSIDGESTGGGFPGWVGNIAGPLRTNNTNYTEGMFLVRAASFED